MYRDVLRPVPGDDDCLYRIDSRRELIEHLELLGAGKSMKILCQRSAHRSIIHSQTLPRTCPSSNVAV